MSKRQIPVITRPSKKYTLTFTRRQIVTFILVFGVIGGGVILYKTLMVKGASYGWLQTTWSGGISNSTSTHLTEQANPGGWINFSSKDALLSTSTDGQLSLTAAIASSTDTSNTDFTAGTSNNVYIENGSVKLKKPNGVACTAASQCTGGCCSGNVCATAAVGVNCGGGIIFQISGGVTYVARTADDSTSAQWGCYGTTISGADSTTNGAQNTIDIVNGCAEAGSAARICSDLSSGGYTDWYLPAKDQLNTMYGLRSTIGGFTTNNYWSSTEVNSSSAWSEAFSNGNQTTLYKLHGYYVRCIRSF